MDVCTGCTTRARVQQKLTQNKQVYSVNLKSMNILFTRLIAREVLAYSTKEWSVWLFREQCLQQVTLLNMIAKKNEMDFGLV
jgi:hypothetical protein